MSQRSDFSPTMERMQDLRIVTRIDERIEDQLDDLIDLLACERSSANRGMDIVQATPPGGSSAVVEDAAGSDAWRKAMVVDEGQNAEEEAVGCAGRCHQSSTPKIDLTFVLPCLNQAHELADSILRLQFALNRIERQGEIIVVDLGSTDDSVKIAEELGARVIRLQGDFELANTGLERFAGREVLSQAQGQVVVLSDCAPESVSRWF
jgi:hypothetical protein